jgi:hypothetical protein
MFLELGCPNMDPYYATDSCYYPANIHLDNVNCTVTGTELQQRKQPLRTLNKYYNSVLQVIAALKSKNLP